MPRPVPTTLTGGRVADPSGAAGGCGLVGEGALGAAAIATALGVGRRTVMRAARGYGRPLVDAPPRCRLVAAGVTSPRSWCERRPAHAVRHRIAAVPALGTARAQLLDVVLGWSGRSVGAGT